MDDINIYQIYNIILHTEIGERIGKLKVSVKDGTLKGMLYLLGKEHECIGTVDEQGKCEFSGTLVTLKNTFSYIATGYLRSSELLMTLKYKTKSYLLKGRPCEA